MSEFMINGKKIPAPVKWQVQEQQVTTAYSGKQTLDGKLHNSVIRTRRIITAQWGLLDGATVSLLRLLFAPNIVSFTFPEANESGSETANFIPGQHTRPVKIVKDGSTYWTSFQIKLTEV